MEKITLKKVVMEKVPEIGKTYDFYDNGVVCETRKYSARCVNILTPDEANDVIFAVYGYRFCKEPKPIEPEKKSLSEFWKDNVEHCRNSSDSVVKHFEADENGYCLYAPTTDYFVCCEMKDYDVNKLWFARTVDGGWFSIVIHNDLAFGSLCVEIK